VRRANLYGIDERNVTHYGQTVEDNVMPEIVDRLERSSDYRQRRAQIAPGMRAIRHQARAGADAGEVRHLLHLDDVQPGRRAAARLYSDGTVLLNHGGTEMGQGLFTKVAQVVAAEFGLPLSAIRVTATDTSKVPNTSASAASASSDLNGKAAQAAAQHIRERLVQLAVRALRRRAAQVRFRRWPVHVGEQQPAFAELVQQAYRRASRCRRPATTARRRSIGTRTAMRGRPFFYFAYGAAVSEVAVDTLTGETQLLRVDILHDVGTSLNPAIDLGQIEGGFLQGVGWLTSEELWWNEAGSCARTRHRPTRFRRRATGRRRPRCAARGEPQSGGHDLSLQGGGRAAADAGDFGVPCDPRCGRQLRRRGALPICARPRRRKRCCAPWAAARPGHA
jgi:xanthine dehydrogenase large subunit